MPKLAESRFVTGPKDPLAVADVYEITENAIRNRAEDIISEISDLLGGVRLTFESFIPEEIIDEVTAILAALSDAVKKMINALAPGLARLISGLGETSDSGSALSFNLVDFPIIWDLGTSQLEVPQTEQAFMEDLDQFINGRKRKTGKRVPKPETLNNGEGSNVNKAAQQMVYSRLTEELVKRKLTKAIPELLGTLTSDDVVQAVALSVLPVALNPKQKEVEDTSPTDADGTSSNNETTYYTAPSFLDANPSAASDSRTRPFTNKQLAAQQNALNNATGTRSSLSPGAFDTYPSTDGARETDLTAVDLLLDHTPIEVVRSRYPRIISEILKGVIYQKEEDIEAFYNRLTSLLERINKKWYLTARNGEEVTDLNVLRVASPHARTLFITYGDDQLKDAALIAHRYSPFSINILLKDQYPFINL